MIIIAYDQGVRDVTRNSLLGGGHAKYWGAHR